jgi:hypothetical protein
MTPDSLEKLLTGYKNWRDIGNDALIGGLIAEIAVIALVSEHWKRKWACELLAGVIVLIGVLIEVKYSGYADEIERQIRQQSNRQVALLNKEAGDARRDAAIAHERAANAELKAAEATENAEQARLETAKIKKEIAWRELTPSQKAQLHDILAGSRFALMIVSTVFDPEARAYADDFVSVLTEAHWKTRLDPEWTHQEPGLFLTVVGFNTSAVADVLEKAFRAADVPYQTMEVPSSDRTIPGGFQSGFTYLMVGRKPRD